MNRRVQLILLTAFLVAALCSYGVYRVVGARIVATQPKTTGVIVAATDIQLGSVLSDADLGTMQIEGTLPEGVILATNRPEAIGRGVTSKLYKGEPILESRLAAPGAGGGLAATIPPGMRACAVRVDEVVGVAGFVTPGMRVDILISGSPPGISTAEGPEVKTLLQNIEVLSAGTDIQKDAEGKPQQVQVVNLLVTPDQAEQLSLASTQAHVQLVLRNPLDTQIAETSGTAVANLYANKNAPPPPKSRPAAAAAPKTESKPKPKPQVYVIQVYNGSKESDAKFASGEEKP